jgi:L-asparaginase
MVQAVLNIPNLKAVVLETFGSGNAPSQRWFIEAITNAISRGIIVLNASQCAGGSVDMGKYSTGIELRNQGVISGFDSTTEAAVTKLMFLLGQNIPNDDVVKLLYKSVCGEITPF